MTFLQRYRGLRAGVVAAITLALAGPAVGQANPEDPGFQGYLQLLAAQARGEGVRESTIAQVMAARDPVGSCAARLLYRHHSGV